MSKFKCFVIFIVFITISCISNAQMVISTSSTPETMINTCLSVHFDYFGNVYYSGQYSSTGGLSQIGYFSNNSTSSFGLHNGIVICTGNVNSIPGAANNFLSQICSSQSDADLESLFNNDYLDAVSFEYDFIDYADTISYRIIFASEEYNQSVCNPDIDAFAVILSGPGLPAGGKNIALVPGSSSSIGINSINNGSAGPGNVSDSCESLQNASLFIENWPSGSLVGFDGFTTVLNIKHAIIPCEQYHVKFVLADAPDNNYDSGVFIEQKSALTCNPYFETDLANNSGDTIPESNGMATYTLHMLCQTGSERYEPIKISGSAVNDIDFIHMADSIHIPAGSEYGTITLYPINDGVPEPAETFIFAYQLNCSSFQTDTIWIADDDSLTGAEDEHILSEKSLNIYPNPSSGEFYINAIDGSVWDINDISGRKVKSGTVRKNKITTNDIKPGVYLLLINKGTGGIVRLVIAR